MGELIPFPNATPSRISAAGAPPADLMKSIRRAQAWNSLNRLHMASKDGMTPQLAKAIDDANQRLTEAWTDHES